MRRIAVVSVGRSDRGHLQPVLDALGDEGRLVECLPGAFTDDPVGVSRRMGSVVRFFASVWEEERPELIVLFGDRYEQLGAAMASLPFAIPLAHLHGGETTIGAFDNQIRNALTKLSHLHLTSHRVHADKVAAMGEEPWRIHVTGAPGLDRIGQRIGVGQLGQRVILVTLHSCTLEYWDTGDVVDELVAALLKSGAKIVWTTANADTYSDRINKALACDFGPPTDVDDNAYLNLMASADVMVGNSSSGIIEAPSFRLPVVNIGNRQKGRLRADNVIDVGTTAAEISDGIRRALEPHFRASLTGANPYGDGRAAPRIAEILRSVPLDRKLLEKA